ncbi:MAG: hypothetical protein NTZ26_04970 [Candidatus Aminicenantes bacterium]|nr:hypothetical protein [Candidatus Aminicenantes bacterium]
MRDMLHNIASTISSKFAARTKAAGAVTGEVIDLRGYNGARIDCISGALGAQVNDYEFEIKEADAAAGAFTAVADEDLLGSEPTFTKDAETDESDTVKSLAYVGPKAFIQVNLKAPTGDGTGSGVLGAIVHKGFARHAPVS